VFRVLLSWDVAPGMESEHAVRLRAMAVDWNRRPGFRRLDVWPTGDLGVRRGFGLAWGIPMPNAKELLPLGDPYRPYRSVVAWYCWRAVELYAGAAESVMTG